MVVFLYICYIVAFLASLYFLYWFVQLIMALVRWFNTKSDKNEVETALLNYKFKNIEYEYEDHDSEYEENKI
ncbi:hypothetical protein [Spiroplasma platyhelix]|uniref:Uncharacterized protein n=1 Tax=Spiroplasma platyhelix PALS-1 TaxID=1276218 RepID=A0A846TS95_9MOLU|nr:hypothetical protein [Spiroplasma platyhelix]MBE4704003.1 hypothetical protein [Spiroplasma platyhelix PALS-1]NKE38375.1 hypothetical protein [Spiroplasma platyhelix PALS-1]UJB29261.1 hypothetical protein SPLAT_v1c04970 [Spiroplasma platyhelix PALS-1]